VDPIPETRQAIEDFGPFQIEDDDLVAELQERAAEVRAAVPECIGLSIGSHVDQVTFTLVATDAEIALLDAVQYLDGGPCVEAVLEDRLVEVNEHDALDEGMWSLFGRASAAVGAGSDHVLAFVRAGLDEEQWHLLAQASAALNVASTLTLPITDAGRVVGTVNLYASTPHAFDGHHEEIAAIMGAWAPGAVTNADLSFSTREVAEQAPAQLRAEIDLTLAWRIIARRNGTDVDTARVALREAARRAGVTEAGLAASVIEVERRRGTDENAE
jgi:GAF domain-containing protein